MEILFLQQPHMAQSAFHQGFRCGVTVLFQQFLFQRTAVDTNADGNMFFFAHIHHSLDPILATDVAGVDADLGRAALRGGNGQPIIKVNVRHQWQRGSLCDLRKALCRIHIRHCQTDDLTTCGTKRLDLGKASLHIRGFCIEHGLDAHRSIAADDHISYLNFTFHA